MLGVFEATGMAGSGAGAENAAGRSAPAGAVRALPAKWTAGSVAAVIALAIYTLSFAAFYPEMATVIDEAAYVSQARLLVEPGNEIVQIDPFTGVESHTGLDSYPLGTALITAPFVGAFGWRAAFAVTCACLLLLVALTARWIADEGSPPGFALLLLGFPAVLVMGRVVMSDVPSAALVSLGLLWFWRGLDRGPSWWLGSGFVAGASWVFRTTNPLLFVPLFLGAVLRRERKAWALVVGGLAGLSVRLVTHAAYFGSAFQERSSYRFDPATIDERLPLYLFCLLVCIPGGLVFALLYRGRRRPEILTTIAAFLAAYLLQKYGTAETSLAKRLVLAPRYLIPLLPVVVFAMAESAPRLWRAALARFEPARRAAAHRVAIAFVSLWAVGIGVACAAVHPVYAAWSATQAELARAIREHVPPDAVLLTNRFGTMKFVEVFGRRFQTLDTRTVAPYRASELVARHPDVYLAMLDRSDSAWWREWSERNGHYLELLPVARDLVADVRPTPSDRLRIWRLSEGRGMPLRWPGVSSLSHRSAPRL